MSRGAFMCIACVRGSFCEGGNDCLRRPWLSLLDSWTGLGILPVFPFVAGGRLSCSVLSQTWLMGICAS